MRIGFFLLGRGGLEPPTHGFSVRCSDSVSSDGATTYANVDPALTALLTDSCRKWPELIAVVEAWPELPEAVKAGIVAMVTAASGGKDRR